MIEISLGRVEIPDGEMRGFTRGAARILVARVNGELAAIDDGCNHSGCSLSEGSLCEFERMKCVRCPCHGIDFEVRSGRNVTIPRICDDQAKFPIREAQGEIFVQIPEVLLR